MLGVGLTAFVMQLKSGNGISEEGLVLLRRQFMLAWRVVTPLALFQPLTAILMMVSHDYELTQTYLEIAFMGYLCAGMAWFVCLLCLKMQIQSVTRLMQSLSENDSISSSQLRQLFRKARRGQYISGVVALLILVIIIFFMSAAGG